MAEPAHKHGLECKEIFAQLSAFLDGELPESTCEEFRAHIADCPPCIEFLNSLRRTVELCHQHASAEQPAPLDSASRQRLLEAYQAMVAARKRGEGPCPPGS